MIHRRLVVVGAGPAGMSAAIVAVEAGVETMVIDENAQVGGQVYRRPPTPIGIDESAPSDANTRTGNELHRKFESLRDRIELLTNATVWAVFAEKRIAVSRDDGWQMIEAEHLVLCPGAYEYVPPFPGWTLPGVMTPGCAQAAVKNACVLPGRRAMIAGTGPFLLVVADQLARAGVEVVGVVEAARTIEWIRALPGLLTNLGLLGAGLSYLRRLKRARIPIYHGYVIIEARGDDAIREAVFAPCDDEWRPDRSRAKSVALDSLCVGYGFVPRTQLAQLAGCRMRFADHLGGWIPQVDQEFQTTVPGVWVAGDGGGVAGALVAQLEGSLVGLTVARRLGSLDEQQFERQRRELASRLRRLRRFRNALDRISRIRPGLTALAAPSTLVCRCEELTRAEVDAGIAAGGTDIRTLKVMTRLGMGPCQGMMCWPAVAQHIADRTGKSLEQIGPASVRPPIKPVCLGTLAAIESTGSEAGIARARVPATD